MVIPRDLDKCENIQPVPLLWSEHINAILHQFPTENIFIHIRENGSENNAARKHSVVSLSNVKILGLLNLESGLLIIGIVFVFSREGGFRSPSIFSLGKFMMLMIFL